jgi:hypothetical protein
MRYRIGLIERAVSGEALDYYVVYDTDSSAPPRVVARCPEASVATLIVNALNGT